MPKNKPETLLLFIIAALLAVGVTAFLWQQNRVTALQHTQLPTHVYASFDDCMQHGGTPLATINIHLSACLSNSGVNAGILNNYEAFTQYNSQNLPRIGERTVTKTENRVEYSGNPSSDLVAFLKHSDEGCENNPPKGMTLTSAYRIIKEVPNRFALLSYGCSNNTLSNVGAMIAMKLGDGWSLLSPTDNFNEQGVASCIMVDMFKISKDVTPQCVETTGYTNGAVRNVDYL